MWSEEEDAMDVWRVESGTQLSFCTSSLVSKEDVIARLRALLRAVAEQLSSDDPPKDCSIGMNKRDCDSNSQVDPILGVRVLYDTPIKKEISLIKQPREFAVFMKVLTLLLRALEKGEFLAKRAVFYADVPLFRDQRIVNRTIEDIACCIEVPRASLGVVSAPKGLVAGPISWSDDQGRITDCSSKVHNIPPLIDTVRALKTSAVAVLVVEKETVFMRLTQSSIVTEVVIVTGRGVPDYASRLFLKMLSDAFEIPIVGLFDMDPWGFSIMMTYKVGSKKAAYDGMNMACTRLMWLGIRPSHINAINKDRRLELTANDRSRLTAILRDPDLPDEYRNELILMKRNNTKAEIESLMAESMELTDIYLPDKFARHDWI